MFELSVDLVSLGNDTGEEVAKVCDEDNKACRQ